MTDNTDRPTYDGWSDVGWLVTGGYLAEEPCDHAFTFESGFRCVRCGLNTEAKPTQPEWLDRFDRYYANTYFRRCDCTDCRAIVAIVEESVGRQPITE